MPYLTLVLTDEPLAIEAFRISTEVKRQDILLPLNDLVQRVVMPMTAQMQEYLLLPEERARNEKVN